MLNPLKGRGLRERALRTIGAGYLYDRLAALETEQSERLRQSLALNELPAADLAAAAANEESAHLLWLRARNQLIPVDFPVRPRVRFGNDLPLHPQLLRRLSTRDEHYRATLEKFLPLLPHLSTIPIHPIDEPAEPNWINLAFPALDAIALYGLLVLHRPRRYLEIGSGFSTKFARRAIRDHALPTRIVSIDPEPRAEIDAICDEVVRYPLEDVPPAVFESVTTEDLVFIDGSHRAFQGSDATVFFTEILPALPLGTLVGVHDIFLPADYPPAWLDWYLSEQYLLACWLLGGDRLQVELPMHHVGLTPSLHGVLTPFWQHPSLNGANHFGGAFFFRLIA
jgi:hypothetical protein